MALLLNGLPAISVRLVIPWRGVWFAEVEVDAPDPSIVPTSGPALLIVGPDTSPVTFLGTIDKTASSSWVSRLVVRVVGGQNGWQNQISAQHFNQAGLSLPASLVEAPTALAAGELPPIDKAAVPFGPDYVRLGGPASRIFGDRDWYVDPTTGIAQISTWPAATLDSSATILDWDMTQLKAVVSCDTVVLPNSVLSDDRFNGQSYTVRDVEQTFDATGSKVECWCSAAPVSRLAETFAGLVREMAETYALKLYRYRFALPGTGTDLVLQAVTPGAPDLSPIHQWSGLSGASALLSPGSEVIVGFAGGDLTQPFVVAFAPGKPLKMTLDASVEIDIGASAPLIKLGPAATPLAFGPPVVTAWGALATCFAAFASQLAATAGPSTDTLGYKVFATNMAGALATIATALATAETATPTIVVKGS